MTDCPRENKWRGKGIFGHSFQSLSLLLPVASAGKPILFIRSIVSKEQGSIVPLTRTTGPPALCTIGAIGEVNKLHLLHHNSFCGVFFALMNERSMSKKWQWFDQTNGLLFDRVK